MEAEVGEVPKPDGKEYDEAAIALTQPDEAEKFSEATGIDTLAVALGSVQIRASPARERNSGRVMWWASS